MAEEIKALEMLEDSEDIFKKRQSVRLTPENAKFYPSDGGLISLSLRGENGTEEFERVVAVRSFPITDPDSFIAIREPDTKNKERGAEIGLKEKLGYIYCDADTTAGKFSFVFRNPSSNVRTLEDKRVMISDIDGNCFVIRDPGALDRASYKRIEVYL